MPDPPPPHPDSAWSALCLRLAVVTLPAQLVGGLVGSVPLFVLADRVRTVPWLAALVVIAMGVVGGLAMGLLSRPPAHRRLAATAVAAGFGLAGFLVLRLLAELRLSGASGPAAGWVVGALLVVVAQSLVLVGVWRRRGLS